MRRLFAAAVTLLVMLSSPACRTTGDDGSRALYDGDPQGLSLADRLSAIGCVAKVEEEQDGIPDHPETYKPTGNLLVSVINGKNPGDCADMSRASIPGLDIKSVRSAGEIVIAEENLGAPSDYADLFKRLGHMNCVAGVDEETNGIPQHPETNQSNGNLAIKTRNGKASACAGWVAAAFPGVVVIEVYDTINEFKVKTPKF